MILETGDMWSILDKTDLFCSTTNATVRKDDALVMGRGLAREVKERFPTLPYTVGARISALKDSKCYGVLLLEVEGHHFGLFQVKYHWAESADLSLIYYSTSELRTIIARNKLQRVDLNYPGIGNGGLCEAKVLPIISQLPDMVHVWRKA